MRGGKAPSALPYAGALRPSTPGDFLPDEKVTKESPGAAPLGTRWCEVSALFALAYASRRAAFCHCRRWICHFEVVRAIGYAVSLGFNEEKYSAVNPWLGRVLVARLDATLGAVRGIGEGVAVQRERGFCAVCAVCAASVQPTNGLIKPFIRLAAQTAQCFYKKIFIRYIERGVRK